MTRTAPVAYAVSPFLMAKAGETTAVVGSVWRCGKSTLISLVQRFHHDLAGEGPFSMGAGWLPGSRGSRCVTPSLYVSLRNSPNSFSAAHIVPIMSALRPS